MESEPPAKKPRGAKLQRKDEEEEEEEDGPKDALEIRITSKTTVPNRKRPSALVSELSAQPSDSPRVLDRRGFRGDREGQEGGLA